MLNAIVNGKPGYGKENQNGFRADFFTIARRMQNFKHKKETKKYRWQLVLT